MNITDKIHKLRIERGWSVARLARETNIPTVSLRVMLSRSDQNGYSIKALSQIGEVLNVPVSYLTQDDEKDARPQITEKQKDDLMLIIKEAVDKYFDVKK